MGIFQFTIWRLSILLCSTLRQEELTISQYYYSRWKNTVLVTTSYQRIEFYRSIFDKDISGILTWFSMISGFCWAELGRTQISGKFSLSNCQFNPVVCEAFTMINFRNFENFNVFTPEKWNNFYLVFSVCFWFPRSFHFYFWESESEATDVP